MSPPSKTKKATSDFKRIKAKVGKRAVKPANQTDTSFKAVSIHLRTQNVTANATAQSGRTTTLDALVSSRGRSFPELCTQLHHPAGAVRLSAAKGLQDILESVQSRISLKQHISDWVHNSARCLIDEDDQVRMVGLELLRRLLLDDGGNNHHGGWVQLLQPFIHAIVTYCSSAINSLDRSTRFHGAEAVAILCRAIPKTWMHAHVTETLLPAFVRLVAEYKVVAPTTTTLKNKKRKRESRAAPTDKRNVLEALVALLATHHNPRRIGSVTAVPNDDSHCWQWDGRGAIILQGNHWRHRYTPPQRLSLTHVLALDKTEMENERYATNQDHTSIPCIVATELLAKLTDKFIELTQRGHLYQNESLRMSWEDLEQMHHVVRAIRILWEDYRTDDETDQTAKWQKQRQQVMSMLLEPFPLYQDGSTNSRATVINTDICHCVIALNNASERDCSKKWMKAATCYVEEQLENDGLAEKISLSLLQVLGQLLICTKSKPLVNRFCSIFFPEKVTSDLACSEHGKAATLLCLELYTCTEMKQVSMAVVEQLPQYLAHWKGNYLLHSRAVMGTLLKMVQQTSDNSIWYCCAIRERLELIFLCPDESYFETSSSIFEDYPEDLQRQSIALLTLLGSPTEGTIGSLGTICARCSLRVNTKTISRMVLLAIIRSLYSIRKTMRMQLFLAFLIDATGLSSFRMLSMTHTEHAILSKRCMAWDDSISEIVSCLIGCGVVKIMPMIHSVLMAFLDHEADNVSHCHASLIRGTLAIITMLALQLKNSDPEECIWELLPSVFTEMVLAATNRLVWYTHAVGESLSSPWGYPLISLVATEDRVLHHVLSSICSKIEDEEITDKMKSLDVLYQIVQNKRMEEISKEQLKSLLNHYSGIHDKLIDGGPLEDASGRIFSRLQVLIATS